MSLVLWRKTNQGEGVIYTSETIDGYEIEETPEGFLIRRIGIECDPIGPLQTFSQAEDTVLKIQISLAVFEDKLWNVSAALALKQKGVQ